MLPDDTRYVRPQCPKCKKLLRRIEGLEHATVVARRTCETKKCGRRYQVLVKFLGQKKAGMFFWDCTLTELPKEGER